MNAKLQSLMEEYDATLIQYKQAQANVKRRELTEVKGQIFSKGTVLSELDAASVSDCKALCTADEQCMGATFSNKKCSTFSSEGEGVPGGGDDYAITNVNLNLSISLNNKLKKLNNQITELVKDQPELNTKWKNEQEQTLNENSKVLEEGDRALNKELKKQNDMVATIGETTIETTMNQYWYWLLLAGVLILAGLFFYLLTTKPALKAMDPNRYAARLGTTSQKQPGGMFDFWNKPASNSSSYNPYSSRSSSSSYNPYSSSRSSSSSSSYNPYSSSSRSSSYNPYSSTTTNPYKMWGGATASMKKSFPEGRLKHNALIPALVMFAATLVASQIQRFIIWD